MTYEELLNRTNDGTYFPENFWEGPFAYPEGHVGPNAPNEEEWRTWRAKLREADNRATAQFRKDLEEVAKMSGQPKADTLWTKAWDMGHSAGLYEVMNVYFDLLDLVK